MSQQASGANLYRLLNRGSKQIHKSSRKGFTEAMSNGFKRLKTESSSANPIVRLSNKNLYPIRFRMILPLKSQNAKWETNDYAISIIFQINGSDDCK